MKSRANTFTHPVGSIADPTEVVSENEYRVGLILENRSSVMLFIFFGRKHDMPQTSAYMHVILPGEKIQLPADYAYTGAISTQNDMDANSTSDSGSLVVTEFVMES